jgi:hypothetical protein
MTIVLGGVGALVGSAIGGPAGAYYGFMIGSAIGGFLDQPKQPDVGKLNDLRYSGSTYGATIPRFWGKSRLAGNIIWVKEDANGNHLVQHKKSSGGKKGGGKYYWYSATFAVAFGQGTMFMPDDSQADGGDLVHRNPVLKKLWANDVLVYDSSAAKNLVTPVFHAGSETESPDTTIVAAMGGVSANAPAYRGLTYLVINDMDLRKFGNQIPNLSAEIWTDAVTVGDIFSDLARMAGVLPTQLDVTSATDSVTGFIELSQSAPYSSMQVLCDAFAYDPVEVDGLIRLVKRGGSSLVTVPDIDMGFSVGTPIKTTRKRKMITDLPGKVQVNFLDAGNSYQQGVEVESWPMGSSNQISQANLPIVMTNTQARDVAAMLLDTAWNSGEDFDFSLGPKYLKYAPADIITIPTDTGTNRVKITSMALAPGGEIRIKAVQDEAAVITQNGIGNGDPPPISTYDPVPVIFDAWSGKELRDEDKNYPGFYVAIAPDPAATGDWAGGVIYYSLDAGTSWIEGPSVTGIVNFGVTTGTLSASGAVANTFDNTNTVGVNLSGMHGSLVNATDSQISGGDNYAVVGDEILSFGTASLTSTYNYTISHLLRGQRSTVMSGHATGDRFVEVTEDAVRINVPVSAIGTTVQVKVLGDNQTLTDVTAINVTIAANTGSDVDALKAKLLTKREITPILVASYGGGGTRTAVSWTTIGSGIASSIPSTAKMVDVYAQGDDDGNHTTRMKIWVRKKSGDPELPVCEGRITTDDAGDVNADGSATVSLDTGRYFDYKVDTGFQDGWSIYVTHVYETPT